MRTLGFVTAIIFIAPTCSLFIASTARAQTATAPMAQPALQPMTQPVAQPAPAQPMNAPVTQPAPIMSAPAMTAPAVMQPAPVASAPAIDSLGGGAIPSLPLDVYTSNGINFINGGIGDEEMAEIKAKANDFNLHVMLSAPKGEYISDVTLRILDSKDTPMVAISDAGPYFYAHLAVGNYTLETTSARGEKKFMKFNITDKGLVKHHVVYNE